MHRWKFSGPASFAGFFVCLTLLFGADRAGAVSEIVKIRTGLAPERTRIVFDLSSSEFEYTRVEESDRHLSLLVAGVVPSAGLETEIAATGRLLRATITREGDSGLVIRFEAAVPSRMKSFVLDSPARLVVDLKPPIPGQAVEQAAPTPKVEESPTPPAAKLPETPSAPPALNPETEAAAETSPPKAAVPRTFDPITPPQSGDPTDVRIDSTPGPTRGGPRVVVIDAGHGGNDPGAVGDGLREKDVCLDVARSLHRELSARKGYHPLLSRSQDVAIPLRQRMQFAEEVGADLFVSVHVNSAETAQAEGVEVFFLSLGGASDETTRALAQRENEILGETPPVELDLEELPFSLSLRQSDTLLRSSLAAESVLDTFVKKKLAATRGVRQASFVVLKSYQVPSILVELGFVSSDRDRRALKKASHRAALAKALADGIDRYFEEFAPSKRTFGGH